MLLQAHIIVCFVLTHSVRRDMLHNVCLRLFRYICQSLYIFWGARGAISLARPNPRAPGCLSPLVKTESKRLTRCVCAACPRKRRGESHGEPDGMM